MRYRHITGIQTAVARVLDDGSTVTVPLVEGTSPYAELEDFLLGGGQIEPAPPPPPRQQQDIESEAIKLDAKVAALARMTPAQIRAYIVTTFPTLNAAQQDVIVILALAAQQVARRI